MNTNAIAKRIIELKNNDLKFRDELVRRGELGKGYDQEMEKIHEKNAEELDKLLT